MITEQVVGHDYTYGQEFSLGLDLVLDGLQTHLDRADRWRSHSSDYTS